MKDLQYDDMTPDQKECYDLFCDLVYGEHHLCGTIRAFGRGLKWNKTNGGIATFDFNALTRLVVFAHDRCIRVEIMPSAPGIVSIVAHKRHTRTGAMHERHPEIEAHIAEIRKAND